MKKVSFDYNLITDRKCRAAAKRAAHLINELLVQSAVAVISIGKEMRTVRAAMTPKMFAAWVETEFHWGYSASYNYMKAAETFEKLPCLQQFQATALFLLCRKAVPAQVIDIAVRRAKAGEIITPSLVRKLFREVGYKQQHTGVGRPRKALNIAQTRKYIASLELTFSAVQLAPSQSAALASRLELMAKTLRLSSVRQPVKIAARIAKPTSKAKRGAYV